jgi:integrase
VSAGRDGNGKRRILVKTFATEKAANRWAAEQLVKHSKGELPAGKCTMNQLFDDLLLHFDTNGKSPWGRTVIEAHLRPFFGSMRADEVVTETIERYVRQRHALGRANGTIVRELTALKRTFNYAHEDFTPPKVAVVPKFPHLKEAPPRSSWFEDHEYQAMLAALPDELRPLLVLAYHTGMRRGEMLGLKWPQVDLLDRIIRLEAGTTKNDEAREVPLGRDVLAALAMQKALRDQYHPHCPWVFFRHATGEPLRDFRGAWNSACRKCGLWDVERNRPTRILHDMRRTAVSNLLHAGNSEGVIMAISGHKSASVFERYHIKSRAAKREAIERQDEYLKSRRAMSGVHQEYKEELDSEKGAVEGAHNLLN